MGVIKLLPFRAPVFITSTCYVQIFPLRTHYYRLDVFGISSIRDEEVDHSHGFDQQVAAQEEDTEDHGEREHAHHGDLHQIRVEGAALVRTALRQTW